ncbi:hypothetical protein LG943_11090 [Streptomonospora sp. S1-112]|uniref:CobQ/CobB/MinD/ParA nucleotide binding domain protein n=1 Tax=Streptomonospora mangrovi TaxID=2883123 RepID=A0A9X3NN70_9ACTN|nr:hypothetical protein [Streptomonospora mangrovi]
MIVSVCSLAGAPGVTTLAAALAMCWPPSPLCVPVMVEADASGGDMRLWHRRGGERGLGTLAAASRRPRPAHGAGDNPLLEHAEEVTGGLHVVTAPSAPHQCTAAVEELAQHPWLLRAGRAAVVDVGRISPRSAGARLLLCSDAVVVVVREDPAQLARLAASSAVVSALEEAGVPVGVALMEGPRRFADREVAEQTQAPVWARLPQDPAGAAFLRGEGVRAGSGVWTRLREWARERRGEAEVEGLALMRTARDLAERVEAYGRRAPSGTGARPAPPEVRAPAPDQPQPTAIAAPPPPRTGSLAVTGAGAGAGRAA